MEKDKIKIFVTGTFYNCDLTDFYKKLKILYEDQEVEFTNEKNMSPIEKDISEPLIAVTRRRILDLIGSDFIAVRENNSNNPIFEFEKQLAAGMDIPSLTEFDVNKKLLEKLLKERSDESHVLTVQNDGFSIVPCPIDYRSTKACRKCQNQHCCGWDGIHQRAICSDYKPFESETHQCVFCDRLLDDCEIAVKGNFCGGYKFIRRDDL